MNRRFIYYFISLLTIFYNLFRGNARKEIKNIQTWVVINATSNVGDMVCTTPVFRAIKHSNPGARLIVVGTRKNEYMMEGNTDIDRYISLDQSLFKIIRMLRAEKIDAGILVNFSAFDFGLLFLSNVKNISGFTFANSFRQSEARAYSMLSSFGHLTVYTPGVYVPGQYLLLLKPFGIETNNIQKHIAYSKKGSTTVDEQLRASGIAPGDTLVAIAPSAGTKVKQWPAERFGQIATYLSEKYNAAIAIIGGPNDVEESKRMISAMHTDVRYHNFAGQSLDELKATVSKVSLIIGNDSGPIYMAESFGSGTLVLVGPTDEAEHPLQDATHSIVMSKNRGKALLQSAVSAEDDIDQSLARSQIEAITVLQVCMEIDDLFAVMKIEKI